MPFSLDSSALICKRLWSSGINSEESIPLGLAEYRFLSSLKVLQIRALKIVLYGSLLYTRQHLVRSFPAWLSLLIFNMPCPFPVRLFPAHMFPPFLFSRRWKRDQQKSEMSRAYSRPYLVGTLPPPPSYKTGGWPPPAQPSPAYPRPGWQHHMDNQNIYAVRTTKRKQRQNYRIFLCSLEIC